MFANIFYQAARISGLTVLLVLLTFCASAAMNVEITNINIDNYPGIHILVRVTDDDGNVIPDLSTYNFEARENGIELGISVEPQFGYMAVTLAMDESSSLTNYEDDVRSACTYFVDGLDGLDKCAIVKFATSARVDVPMTYDRELLYNSIANYQTNGFTDLWNAIYLGIQECYYEPERKAVVTFTDGIDNIAGISAAELPGLAGPDITLYNIGIGGQIEEDSLIYVAEQTGGFYLHIATAEEMQEVLEDIRADVDNLYDVYYNTPLPFYDGSLRMLEVVCSFAGATAWDTASYTAPLLPPPELSLTSATTQYLGTSQPSYTGLHIACNVDNSSPIVDARLYYKVADEPYYSQVDLIPGAGSSYYYDIPAPEVQMPGILFYLQVTDELGNTATLPEYNPALLPFCIPVLTNYVPEIVYPNPSVWLHRQSFPVRLLVEDITNEVDEVVFYYREPGSFFYTDVVMEDVGDSYYECLIEGPELDERYDFECFVAAWDDQGTVSYWYSSDDPFYLDVVVEPWDTRPVPVLEPENPPVSIPAYGGEFYYTLHVINPIPDYADCDAWADLVYPDGSVEELDLVIEDIVLGGGAETMQYYLQEVPGTAPAGDYQLRFHTGDYEYRYVFYTASIPFTKLGSDDGGGPYNHGWRWFALEEPPGFEGEDLFFLSDAPIMGESYPNPFNPTTQLNFSLPEAGMVDLSVYSITGAKVAQLIHGQRSAGTHWAEFRGDRLASGMYLARLEYNGYVITQRLILTK